MEFIRHIRACNQHDPTLYTPFIIDGISVGKIRLPFIQVLQQWPEVFRISSSSVTLQVSEPDLARRSAAVSDIVDKLIEEEILPPLCGELYAAMDTTRDKALLLIDRAIAPYFGIRSYGQHINGYVRTDEGMKLWIARRAFDRANYPGCLDNFVAGGLPYGIDLAENLVKECWEEAGLPAKIAGRAVSVSSVSYTLDTKKGYNPLTLFCYDLEVPQDFVPHCTDGEVESFSLKPVEEVMEIVKSTDEFKLNCNLVIIDFLIRHGYLGPDDDGYSELLKGLYPSS